MEGRKGEEIPNPMGFFSPPQIIQDSPLKLPLAPLFPTPHDRRGNPTVSTRRGSSIFSPTQTLDPPHHHHNFSPPPPQINGPTPNPDPPTSLPSDSRNQSPPQAPPPPPPPVTTTTSTSSVIRYKECLKNHAASMGGHVVDGCGEFMPSGDDGTPHALRCAACDCHRNFHRREADGQPQPFHSPHAYNPNSGSHRQTAAHHQLQHSYPQGFATPPTMVSFGGGAAAVESSSEDLNMFQSSDGAAQAKKRHRTKFRQEQKDRMHEFATKLGWRIQKQEEQEVQEFCSEVGVKRQAFKIWMHNNKQAIKKRSSSET